MANPTDARFCKLGTLKVSGTRSSLILRQGRPQDKTQPTNRRPHAGSRLTSEAIETNQQTTHPPLNGRPTHPIHNLASPSFLQKKKLSFASLVFFIHFVNVSTPPDHTPKRKVETQAHDSLLKNYTLHLPLAILSFLQYHQPPIPSFLPDGARLRILCVVIVH